MRYAILNVVPDQVDDKPVKGLFDLHEIESVTPDTVGKENWLHLKNGNSYLIQETPEQVLELINEG